MSRTLRILAVLALLAAVVTVGRSAAAFVDEAETAAPAQADHVKRWLGLAAPGAATCVAPNSTRTTGTDESALVAVGGSQAATAAGRTVDCTLVLEARAPLPENAPELTVRVAPTGAAGDPVTAAALTALDGTGAGDEATLAAGERRALRLTVRDRAQARGTVAITVDVGTEETGFLRYDLPVDVCAGALGRSCDDDNGGGGGGGGNGSGSGGSSGGSAGPPPPPPPVPPGPPAPVVGSSPSTGPRAAPRTCVSRRRFAIRMPRMQRDERLRWVKVAVAGKVRPAKLVKRHGRYVVSVDLRKLGRTSVRVVATGRTTAGRKVREVRRYRTCVPKARKQTPPAGSKARR